ncbi:nucleoside recognition domain-containing protein [Agriterribacter sp.]|uniref:nucleoside recognition domain-containing protein n=1 Tax=Agriterribacter sp. TaxID=2821509 RepID=UPI002C39EA2C|nr:nucleoside recognition domain-containing protein [Agriterribacter sp.]HTN05166.1 nucleoside recognition domain-containing protein [Agriterribacter sp.]
MALSYIWMAFFLLAFVIAFIKWAFLGDMEILKLLVDGIFKAANDGFDISLKLVGIMSLFLGFMKIGEKAGAINFLSRLVAPFFSKLFPEVPKNHPATGHMMMNFSANLLGLDNAATPFGIKAMESLQELNPNKETASNSQLMFLILHASGLTLIPVSVMAMRASVKVPAANPTDIFVPCMIVTFAATMAALLIVSFRQKIRLFQPVILAWIGGISALIAALVWYLTTLSQSSLELFSSTLSSGIILLIFLAFLLGGWRKKINMFDAFVEGAKGGFEIAVRIIPYLIAMLVAISVLRNSGVFGYITEGFRHLFTLLGMNTDFVEALPTALMKPLSGAGARGMMVDAMNTHGADSFIGRLSSIFQGTSDTTFYVVAVYFGAVAIKNTRYAIPVMLLADLAGVITAIAVGYLFFH